MALQNGGIEGADTPSQPPTESNSSSVNGSPTATAATPAASTLSDSSISEEPKKDRDDPETPNIEVPCQEPSDSAGARSRSPRPGPARRRSVSDDSSDSDESLEGRILRAPKQRRNMTRYALLMEDRVKALESKVRSLEGDKKPSQSSSVHTTAVKKDPLEKFKLLNSINRVSDTDYKKKDQRHVIDVLVSDNMDVVLDKDHQSDTPGTQKPASRLVDTTTTTIPERIRINCGRLLVELDGVTEQETENVFLAPFTFFATYEQKIREHVAVLEKKSRGEDVAIDSGDGAEEASAIDTDKKTPAQSQQQPQTSGDAVNDAESEKPPNADLESQTGGKSAEAANGAETTHGLDQDEEEEIDEGDLLGEDILAVVEDCQVSRHKAVKALKKEGFSWYRACTELRRSMTKEELKRAEASKATFLLQSWKTMIAVMDNDLRPKMELCSRISKKTLKEISYEDLGYLFKPGDVVLASEDQRLQALAVLATTGGRKLLHDSQVRRPTGDEEPESFFHTSGGHSPFVVDCFYYDFDGTNFGAILRSITIPKYEGRAPVNRLAVYPESLSGDANRDLKLVLAERGRKFVQLCSLSKIAHRTYTGRTLDDPPEEVDSQVIIDCHMAAIVPSDQRPDKAQWMPILGMTQPTEPDEREISEVHADCHRQECGICNNPRTNYVFNHQKFARQQSKEYVTSEEIVNRPFGEGELREHQFMLLPYRVFGFVLRSRKWARLDIDKISDITPPEHDNFQKLVLPEGHQDIVQALVETHFKQSLGEIEKSKVQHNVDLVRGKGKGLIILLHGAPGVGKTSTAECVAEFTRRPLFSMTCGDIGESAGEVESNLDRCFQLAHKWGCVLLLDEADVFLAKRDRTDLKRNALVSVFLRVLEYYAGILFLTTNRVGTFDDAFKSRIHVSLYYPELKLTPTLKVWRMNLARTRENLKHVDIEEDEIMEFAEKQYKKAKKEDTGRWNGRQIRNAFQTAIALAEWDLKIEKTKTAKLTRARFEKVEKASREFDKYLKDTHGGANEGERAQHLNERLENWDVSTPKSKARKKGKVGKNRDRDSSDEEDTPKKKKKGKKGKDSEEDSEENGNDSDE
ncbi:MAG: hypothetical protein ASARMPREDX12_003343 [Alectoria sarmentosa]|nr:MAG: hypothetical protein ASARMPREDX12_003343 [Alectoria sarmentosa]